MLLRITGFDGNSAVSDGLERNLSRRPMHNAALPFVHRETFELIVACLELHGGVTFVFHYLPLRDDEYGDNIVEITVPRQERASTSQRVPGSYRSS